MGLSKILKKDYTTGLQEYESTRFVLTLKHRYEQGEKGRESYVYKILFILV